MQNVLLFSITIFAAFLFKVTVNKYEDKKREVAIEESEVKISPKKIREPASITLKNPQRSTLIRPSNPGFTQSERRSFDSFVPGEEAVENVEPVSTDSEQKFAANFSSDQPPAAPSSPRSGPRSFSDSSSGSKSKSSSQKPVTGTTSAPAKALGPFPGPGIPFNPPKSTTPTTSTTSGSDTTSGSSGGGPSSSSSISCSASIGGGAFTNPISVAITCTSSATINYCLSSSGTCCDPETSGTIYSTNLIVGSQDGSYCLSFNGTNSSGVDSAVVQQTYVINNELPHLESTHEKIYYQTTELEGETNVASDDFGKVNFGVGILNLYSNDPGPTGLDQTCEEIVTNYVTYPAPTPISILSFFDTSAVAATSQLDVPLRPDQLQYGDNFITTYIKDTNNASPLYSCSTTKVKLEDFPYFQADVYHGDSGTDTVREFSGGFVAYGFFEAETNVFRGPAGSSSEDSSGQKLESGLMQVFY